jgi:hypothetical protein
LVVEPFDHIGRGSCELFENTTDYGVHCADLVHDDYVTGLRGVFELVEVSIRSAAQPGCEFLRGVDGTPLVRAACEDETFILYVQDVKYFELVG